MTICDDVQKTTDIKLSPQHLFCASLLSRIAELVSSAPQEVINATIKVSASNIHKMLKLEGYLKDNYSSFEELIMDINRAFEFCDDLNVVSNDDDCVEVVLCDKICGCKYCPKTIGEAEIDGSACPIPILFEQIGKKEGFDIMKNVDNLDIITTEEEDTIMILLYLKDGSLGGFTVYNRG